MFLWSPPIYASLPDHPGTLVNRILFKLEALNNWKMTRYTGYKIISKDLVKVIAVRVVAIRTDPNVFPTTLATGDSGRRRWKKGTPSPQRSVVPSGGARSLAMGCLGT
jgi:hypothetical protein